ncbi:hypothetical protein H0H93_004015 [Arthromyces matolae]|nr:hypothetical protein H0H93_004015 [Arthromyces matolae]
MILKYLCEFVKPDFSEIEILYEEKLACFMEFEPADQGGGKDRLDTVPGGICSVCTLSPVHVFSVLSTTTLHMDSYHPNIKNSSPTFLPTPLDNDDRDDQSKNSMKAPKRKRLAKACDACHKSKRRCDGTVKPCTYTDSAGRPVPAPRPFKQDRHEGSSQASTSANPPPFSHDREEDSIQNGTQSNLPRKRFRNDRGTAVPTEDISIPSIPIPIVEPSLGGPADRPPPLELDHALTRELTNLFFTHCHPARLIIHKPTFTAHLAHNRVPVYLLHAMCALAAPLSKQPKLRTTPSRFAGERFAQEAQSLMFDGAGRLVCERNLTTAQALCILQFHDLKAKDSNMQWDFRYHDMAMQLIESLNVYQHDYPTLTPVPSPEFIQASIEREAVRRMFWIIHFLDNLAWIYFKKPMQGLQESGRRLRLPVDETTFELGVHSTLPEYLYLPAVRMQYSSEFGHLIRVITIYAKVESALDELTDSELNPNSNTAGALHEAERMMDSWASTLPDHLRFSEQSLQVQQSMFETSSNGGAWCWCCMHVFHASSALALNFARQQIHKGPKSEPAWALKTLDLIMEMFGDRAKNSILMAAAIWPLIRYCQRDDPQLRSWCSIYEEEWGTRIDELALERYSSYPPSSHSYGTSRSQTSSQQHLQQPEPPQQHSQPPLMNQHRRLEESRNPPITGARPSSHQHDSSFNRASSSSSPTSLAIGRPLEELRMHNNYNSSASSSSSVAGYNRSLQSQSRLNSSQCERNAGVHNLGGSGGTVAASSGSGIGVKREREMDGSNVHGHGHMSGVHAPIRRPGDDVDGNAIQVDGVIGVRAGESVSGQSQLRNAGSVTSGEGQQSLPSLKSVGLLAVQHQVSMPVGLQWLANESR